MVATKQGLYKYLHLMPDEDTTMADLAFEAALVDIKGAGVHEFRNNALYDIFVYALAGYYYDNRSLNPIGTKTEESQNMINSFVLKLRFAEDGPEPPAEVSENG